MLAAWLKTNYRYIWWFLFGLSAAPALWLFKGYLDGSLGYNPLETLMHTSGRWSLIFLLLSLTITPLRRGLVDLASHMHSAYGKRLSDWNWIIRLRRMIGLYSFFYATLHLLVYVHFDLGWDWQAMAEEFEEKPYIFVGLSAYILLLPIAFTSTNGMIRWLGSNWRRLHRLAYGIVFLVVLHYWLQVKVGDTSPWPYIIFAVYLLGDRLVTQVGWLRKRPVDDGLEVPEQGACPNEKDRRQVNSSGAGTRTDTQTPLSL